MHIQYEYCWKNSCSNTYQDFVVADSFLYVLNTRRFSSLHCVVSFTPGHVKQEVMHHLPTILRQINLWMELYSIQFTLLIGYPCKIQNIYNKCV